MNVLSLIKSIFKPAVDLVDELHTSDEERLQQKAATLDTYVRALEQGLEFEHNQLETKARIIEAEARSEHWLTATWRPITMLFLVALVGMDSFGLLANPLADEAWLVIQLGIGGYVVSRGIEKTAKAVVGQLKSKEEL